MTATLALRAPFVGAPAMLTVADCSASFWREISRTAGPPSRGVLRAAGTGTSEPVMTVLAATIQVQRTGEVERMAVLNTRGLARRASEVSHGCLQLRIVVPARAKRCVTSDMTAATALRITGTPTFLIGTVDRGTTVVQVREHLEGAQPMSVFRLTLERLIAEAK